MKAAVVVDHAKPPQYRDFAEPKAAWDEELVTIGASAISQLAKGRAAGRHYSSSLQLPAVAGVDGVGRLENGERVYFILPMAPFGAMAERVAMARDRLARVPDGIDDVTAAAIANPGMSSWAALTERAHVVAGETVLINGATGASGRLAVRIAKILGARKVIALGRNAQALAAAAHDGADVTISLLLPPEELRAALVAEFRARVDIVLDYLWGESAAAIVESVSASEPSTRVRYVQIGTAAARGMVLEAHVLRATGLVMMGSGLGSVAIEDLLRSIEGVFDAAADGALSMATDVRPLADVERAWLDGEGEARIVLRV